MRDTAKTDTESSTKTPKPGGSALARAFWRALAFTSMLFGLLAACGGSVVDVAAAATPALGAVDYVSGDFNGDGISDLLVVTSTGSSLYLGLRSGGFQPDVWVRPDLTRGAVNYIPGDFNGDGTTDLIIVTASGSYEYLGMPGGGFNGNVWVRNDLPLGQVQYVAGDFNGDGVTDLIIVTASGSYEYTGLRTGGFNGCPVISMAPASQT